MDVTQYRLELTVFGFEQALLVMDAFNIPFVVDDRQENTLLFHNPKHKEAVTWYLQKHFSYKGFGMDELVEKFRKAIQANDLGNAHTYAQEITHHKHTILADDALTILAAVAKEEGYCPCFGKKIPSKMCPCNAFLKVNHCHCLLFVQG